MSITITFPIGYKPVLKHGEHDQSTHGSWATGASGGNNLGLQEVIGLHKSSDSLKEKVYEAEQSFDRSFLAWDKAPKHPQREIGESDKDYDKRYKEYSKKHMDWAVNQQTNIFSETGKKLLDGTPAGVKKYAEEIIKTDWFIENFGDGSSLPKLDVKISNTNAAGRHILQAEKNRATGEIISKRHEISIDRQFVKSERTILHEIAHYATAISQTKSFEAHGIEFARTHLFIVSKAAGSERAKQLESAYKEKGVNVGN